MIMSWPSPRLLVPLAIVCLVLVVGVGATLVYLHNSNPSSDITLVCQSAPTSFSQQDQQIIQTALQSALLASNPARITGHESTIIDEQRQGDWDNYSAN